MAKTYRYPLPILAALVLLGALLAGLDGTPAAQERVRASTVCLDCHEGRDATLAGTMHGLGGEADSALRVACTDCHGGDSRHYEDDPEKYPMTNPAKLDAFDEARLCSTCHQTAHQQNMLGKNVHTSSGVSCSSCHSVHEGLKHATLLRKEEPNLCYSCHGNVEGQFARSYRHPVNDGVVKCSECHMTLAETSRELSKNGTNMCTKCHGEFQGPFPYEHQATLDFSTEEGGCLNCHAPHGSDNPRMLTQPYEAPNFQLCSQCHTVPGHQMNPEHGSRWAGLDCNTCHSDIHGSYDNRFFLNETLKADGCLKAGCHGR